jgi:hypothetical protein
MVKIEAGPKNPSNFAEAVADDAKASLVERNKLAKAVEKKGKRTSPFADNPKPRAK